MSLYALNPMYRLRNDERRSVLYSIDESMITIIHPLHAMTLSFFDIPREMDQTISLIVKYLGLNDSDIRDFVIPLVNNDSKLWFGKNGNNCQYPERVIVEAEQDYEPRGYSFTDFMIKGEMDLFSDRLYIPLDMLFVVNTQCFTDCVYCYANRTTKMDLSIPMDRVFEIFDEAKRLQMKSLDFSGGDFFLCKDWEAILKEAIDDGFSPRPSTKIPLNSKMIEKYKKTGAKTIQLSLDNSDSTILERTLQVKNDYYEKMQLTINNLDFEGIRFRVNSVLSKGNLNYDGICKMIDYMLKFESFDDISIGEAGFSLYKTEKENREFLLDFDEANAILSRIKERYKDERKVVVGDVISFDENFHISNNDYFKKVRCTGNYSGFVLLPNGDVTICEELYWHPSFLIGNLCKQGVAEMWQSERALNLANLDKGQMCDTCSICDDFDYCHHHAGKCWKLILKSYGMNNWNFPDPRCMKSPQPLYRIR